MSLHKEMADVLGLSERQVFRRISEKHRPTLDLLATFMMAADLGDSLGRIRSTITSASVALMDIDAEFAKWLEEVENRIACYRWGELAEVIDLYRRSCQKVDRKHGCFGWSASEIWEEERNRDATRKDCLAKLKVMIPKELGPDIIKPDPEPPADQQ